MDEIIVVEYDPQWQIRFAEEAASVWQVLGIHSLQIEHIGSTAVPELAAKPIIDLMVGVKFLDDAKSAVSLLETLGYIYWRDDPRPGRMFFVKGMPPYGKQRTHHLHIVEVDSEEWEQRLLFRDYLCHHPDEAQRYAALKYELAAHFRCDREAYTNAKSDYILSAIQKAR